MKLPTPILLLILLLFVACSSPEDGIQTTPLDTGAEFTSTSVVTTEEISLSPTTTPTIIATDVPTKTPAPLPTATIDEPTTEPEPTLTSTPETVLIDMETASAIILDDEAQFMVANLDGSSTTLRDNVKLSQAGLQFEQPSSLRNRLLVAPNMTSYAFVGNQKVEVFALPSNQLVTTTSNPVQHFVWSPDASSIAFVPQSNRSQLCEYTLIDNMTLCHDEFMGNINAITYSEDGTLALSVSTDQMDEDSGLPIGEVIIDMSGKFTSIAQQTLPFEVSTSSDVFQWVQTDLLIHDSVNGDRLYNATDNSVTSTTNNLLSVSESAEYSVTEDGLLLSNETEITQLESCTSAGNVINQRFAWHITQLAHLLVCADGLTLLTVIDLQSGEALIVENLPEGIDFLDWSGDILLFDATTNGSYNGYTTYQVNDDLSVDSLVKGMLIASLR